MYKCLDNGEQREVIILDVEGDEGALAALRRKSRSRELTCPQCHQAVQAKAGDVKAWHFAHLDLGACPLLSESASLLKARRLLYEWLVRKFVERPGLQDDKKAVVTVEKMLSPDLPRPVDCYVEHPDGTKLAYWVFDRGARQRWALKHALSDYRLHAVFLQEMMCPVSGADREFDLSPTEREFMSGSDFDRIYLRSGNTLNYLSVEDGVLTTLRGLELRHAPQRYVCAAILRHPLAEVLTTKLGEFIHPGETEKLHEFKESCGLATPAVPVHKSAWRLKLDRRLTGFRRDETAALAGIASERVESPQIPHVTSGRELLRCEVCGRMTAEWSVAVPDRGTCKCRECLEMLHRQSGGI